MKATFFSGAIALVSLFASLAMHAATLPRSATGDSNLDAYFAAETDRLARRTLAEVKSLEDWNASRERYRRELFEMLSLSPLPERGDLKPVITGRVEHEQFTVEKLHYQSIPGLYVTANLYVPKGVTKPLPAILYVCGHALVKTNGVSYGNKAGYQHHGAWFARNGYVCLTIDTVQLGELEGIHHGTHRENMWWWNARGHTSAGTEAWNCIRALDYLQMRPEVDPNRIGVTGRSGGGAYSWWIAALDDRIKVAAPVAGITDLHNHVVDGAVEGHCDCMFTINTYRWDYAKVAALVAPRPLLIINTDSDVIFPLDGVQRIHADVRPTYQLHKADEKLGLVIGPGPHKDTQDLQVPAFRWFNRWLKGDDAPVGMVAEKLFTPAQLKVFEKLPTNQRTTKIHETFVPMATNQPPQNTAQWAETRDQWLATLKQKSFAGWPESAGNLNLKQVFSAERDGVRLEAWDFDSQPHVRLRLYVMRGTQVQNPERVLLAPLDNDVWTEAMKNLRGVFGRELWDEGKLVKETNPNGLADAKWLVQGNHVIVGLAPRGVGLTGFVNDARKQVQIKRRFQLLGQTLDGMRVWDIQRAAQAVRELPGLKNTALQVHGKGDMGVNALYASLFIPEVAGLDLEAIPSSHMRGPDYLNVLRFLDVPQAVAMAAEHSRVELRKVNAADWDYARQTATRLNWPADKLRISND